MNIKAIATEVGEYSKYDTTINDISRTANALFNFSCQNFANDAITSARSKLIYDWILTLGRQPFPSDHREKLLIDFCKRIISAEKLPGMLELLVRNGLSERGVSQEEDRAFHTRGFHASVVQHCRKLYLQSNYFHAVFEACKLFNAEVKSKARSSRDGEALMMSAWDPRTGVLKITPCVSETDINVQDGVKFMSAGLMRAIRNSTAHEPALKWPISKEDCLDLLSFISFLFRQLDKAVYHVSP